MIEKWSEKFILPDDGMIAIGHGCKIEQERWHIAGSIISQKVGIAYVRKFFSAPCWIIRTNHINELCRWIWKSLLIFFHGRKKEICTNKVTTDLFVEIFSIICSSDVNTNEQWSFWRCHTLGDLCENILSMAKDRSSMS